jgi:S-methylmethionine-dependent homocysteine/selenocysteine methylase
MKTHGELLRRRFESGILVLDGATGTELERHGLVTSIPLWSAAGLFECPELVEQVHRDYAAAGADIVIANTFRTNARTLEAAGMLESGAELNACAVWLARQAVSSEGVLVAGSVGPVADCYCPELTPEEVILEEEHAQMAEWLQAAGADLLWIETIGTVREARAAAAAAYGRGLPFAISFILAENGTLLGGEPLEAAVAAVEKFRPLAIGLNCIPPRGLTALLPELRQLTRRPVAAYGHINNPTPIRGWSYSQAVSPAEYGDYARQWLDLGASIVGGCCGTTPEHIAAVRAVVSACGAAT